MNINPYKIVGDKNWLILSIVPYFQEFCYEKFVESVNGKLLPNVPECTQSIEDNTIRVLHEIQLKIT
jgi:hypothetical protein